MQQSHLRALLIDSALSPEELGRRLGVSGMTVRRWLARPGNPTLEPLYASAVKDATFRLLIEGRVSSEHESVKSILSEADDLPQRAALRMMGVKNGLQAKDLKEHPERVLAALVEIGSSEARREAVRDAKRSILSYRKLGSEWTRLINELLVAVQTKSLVMSEKLAAFGALFYLISPFDLIPDALPVFGLIDDFALLGIASKLYSPVKKVIGRKTGPKIGIVGLAMAAALTTIAVDTASALTLEQAIEAGLEKSPQVRAQKRLANYARGDRWRRFLINEPVATYSSGDDQSLESYGVSLTIPFPGRVFASFDVDRAKSEAAEREAASRTQDVTRTTAQAYMECAAARTLIDIQRASLADLDTLSRTIHMLYESGRSTQAEKIGSELQMRQARVDLTAAEDKSTVACRRLASALFEDVAPATDGLPTDLDPARVRALGSKTADQLRAQGAIQLAEATHGASYWSQAPDITLTAARGHYLFLPASPSTHEWATTFTASMTFPMFFLFQENVEARRSRAQADLDRSSAQIQLRSADVDRIEAARDFRRSQARLKELREKDLILAQALIESTLAAYRLGRLGFAEVLFARRTLSDLRVQDAQLKVTSVLARLRCLDSCEDLESVPEGATPK